MRAYVSMNKVYRMVILARRCMYMPKAVCMSKGYVRFIFVMRIIRILSHSCNAMHACACLCVYKSGVDGCAVMYVCIMNERMNKVYAHCDCCEAVHVCACLWFFYAKGVCSL
jgi:hypothetical protein